MERSKPTEEKQKYQKEYFRLTFTYSDDETSGRIFTNRGEIRYKTRKSLVVKKTKIEPFTRNQCGWHKERTIGRTKRMN
jgi:hypothetical protein